MAFSIQSGKVTNFTATLSTSWLTVKFPTAFDTKIVPVVLAQIQTRSGQDTPGLRLRNISNTGFEVRMEELIMDHATSATLGDLGYLKGDGTHPNAETLGWVAIAN